MRSAAGIACLVAALVLATAAHAKWAGGMILLPCKGVTVDGATSPGGTLVAGQEVTTGAHEARLYVRGAAGRALVVLAPHASVTLGGGPTDGVQVHLLSGAVRVVMKSSGKTPVVTVRHVGSPVELPEAGGVVVVEGEGGAAVHDLGSDEALSLFPQGAPAAAAALPAPATGLPLIGGGSGAQGGEEGQEMGGDTEVEGESQCLDSSGSGPEGADPTTDGTDPTEIDRTHTRVRIIVTW